MGGANSFAVRLPQAVVAALELKQGDEIEITVASKRNFAINRDRRRERALEVLRSSQWKFPTGWKFDREEASRWEVDGPTGDRRRAG
jgi:antitoxin MazE